MKYRIVSTCDEKYPYAVQRKWKYWPFWLWLRCSTGGDWTPRAGFKSLEEAHEWIASDKSGRHEECVVIEL